VKELLRLIAASLAAASALLVTCAPAQAQNASYDIVELAASAPTTRFGAHRINESNAVLGTYSESGTNGWAILRPDGSVKTLTGVDTGGAGDINALGNAVYTNLTLPFDMVSYDAATDTASPILGQSPINQQEFATAIDDAGTIYGFIDGVGGTHSPGPFLIRDGQFKSLATVLGASASLNDANQSGVVVGEFVRQDGGGGFVREPYRYDVSRRRAQNLIALLGSRQGTASAVNAASSVGGMRYETFPGPTFGYVLVRRRVHDAFLPGATDSGVLGINDRNEAVGYSNTGSDTPRRAILWRGGETIDLSTLPEVVAAGWSLSFATDINNGGVIACTATRVGSSQSRVVLLIPKAAGRQ
jgi:hypothetical protein